MTIKAWMRPLCWLLLATQTIPAFAQSAPAAAMSDIAEVRALEEGVALVLAEQGFEAYAGLFHPDYSNWGDGRAVMTRAEFLAGVRPWYDAGNRATRTTLSPISTEIFGDLALSRYQLREDFNNGNSFVGRFASIARRHEGRWRLFRTNFTTLYRGPSGDVPDALLPR